MDEARLGAVQVVNKIGKKLSSQQQIQRTTTHIRVKWAVKFALERWMRKHHCRTYSQAIKKLLEGAE